MRSLCVLFLCVLMPAGLMPAGLSGPVACARVTRHVAGQAALARNFGKHLVNMPEDELMQSALHLRLEDVPGMKLNIQKLNIQKLMTKIVANGQHLLDAQCFTPPQAGEIGQPSKAAPDAPPAAK